MGIEEHLNPWDALSNRWNHRPAEIVPFTGWRVEYRDTYGPECMMIQAFKETLKGDRRPAADGLEIAQAETASVNSGVVFRRS
jgi:hypothetical protein